METKTVWACGAGVDSTAIAALIVLGHLPKPDYAYMIDPGYEKQKTWTHVNSVLIPQLSKVGITLHIIPSPNCNIILKERVVIPAYVRNSNGTIGRYPTNCGPWKEPISKRWLKEQGVKQCENWIGIAADESKRQRRSLVRWFKHKYPLLELGLTRQDCLDLIARMDWPEPPQTSCIMCPQQTDKQWAHTKEHYPDEWQRVIDTECDIQRTHPNVFLHRSCVPIDQVEFGKTGQSNSDRITKFFE